MQSTCRVIRIDRHRVGLALAWWRARASPGGIFDGIAELRSDECSNAFVSPSPLPYPAKAGVAILTALLLVGYLSVPTLLLGRPRDAD